MNLLFPDLTPTPVEPTPADRFPGAAVTQRDAVAHGRHPLGRALPGPEGETCGTCGHSRNVNDNLAGKAIYQCEEAPRGISRRVRVRWPACTRWASPAAVEEDRLAEWNAGRMP